MNVDENLSWKDRFGDWLSEQAWYESIKSQWEELDPENRRNLRLAIILVVLGAGIVSALWSGSGTWELARRLERNQEVQRILVTADEELRTLKSNPRARTASLGAKSWGEYVISLGVQSGIDRSSLEALPEKAGEKSGVLQEALFGVKAKNVTIRQLIRFLGAIDTGKEAVKVTSLSVRTIGYDGYLELELQLSGTSILERK